MGVNTIEHVGFSFGLHPPKGIGWPEGWSAHCTVTPVLVDIDRTELERRLRIGLLKHKFVVMIDDEEAAGVARDLAEEVLR